MYELHMIDTMALLFTKIFNAHFLTYAIFFWNHIFEVTFEIQTSKEMDSKSNGLTFFFILYLINFLLDNFVEQERKDS